MYSKNNLKDNLLNMSKEEVIDMYLKELKCKKYGLVWEDTPELIDSKDIYPLLKEQKDLTLNKLTEKPMNYLIEGDNYHSLKALQKTHLGKIDVIYIDPPYNTGNEFVYNDKIVDKEDNFKHSKWLSFMEKRLKLAKNLLSEDGVIFVSIDDNEQAQLKLLMDEVFGEDNHVTTMIWKQKSGGSNDSIGIVTETEYIHVYTKIGGISMSKEPVDTSNYPYKDVYYKERGKYKLEKLDRSSIQYSPSLDYPIYSKEFDEQAFPGGSPEKNTIKRASWRWGRDKVNWGIENGYIEFKKNKDGEVTVYTKQYAKVDNNGKPLKRGNPYRNYIDFVNTSKGRAEMKEIFDGFVPFSYPKPVELIKHLLKIAPKQENTVVLDFFAGSGTTGHAVMELNKEDGGNRSFILCTNNEVSEEKERSYLFEQGLIPKNNKTEFNKYKKNNPEEYQEFLNSCEYQELGIARSVTRERLKRVIEGYTTPKGVEVEGLLNNLMYLKTDEIYKDSFNFGDSIPLAVKDTLKLVYPSTTHKINIVDILTNIDGLELGDNIENIFLIDSKDDETTSMLNNKIIKKFGMDTKVELVSKYL